MTNNIWDDLNIERTSNREQAETATQDMANTLGSFRQALMANGFSKEEALYLVGQWLVAVIQANKK